MLSPKGLGDNYKSKIVVDYNSNKKQVIRKSSIEESKNLSDSKFNSGIKAKEKSYVTTVTTSISKKQAKSPQPSSNMMSTNLYMKTL